MEDSALRGVINSIIVAQESIYARNSEIFSDDVMA